MLNKLLENNFDKLNSMTKYPSIYTYHKLGQKGKLENELLEVVENPLKGYVFEKINGTNVRIILSKTDFIIGSREELLYSKGDRVKNKTMDIVSNVIHIAEKLLLKANLNFNIKDNGFIVIYGEFYGGTVGREKINYSTNNKLFGFRTFDVVRYSEDTIYNLLDRDLNNISNWRENGGQDYLNIEEFREFCKEYELDTAPKLCEVDINNLPKGIQGMYDFLTPFSKTKVGLNVSGESEGIIIRSNSRKYIRKIRFEEYKRTLNIKKNKI